jgi:hypothetical protein
MVGDKGPPSWTDVKGQLADLDRATLLGPLRDLYKASKDNQTFFHTRYGLGADVLRPYKATIDRWLFPDAVGNQCVSVARAKKSDRRLQEGRRPTGRTGRADGVLLRTRRQLQSGNGASGRRLF